MKSAFSDCPAGVHAGLGQARRAMVGRATRSSAVLLAVTGTLLLMLVARWPEHSPRVVYHRLDGRGDPWARHPGPGDSRSGHDDESGTGSASRGFLLDTEHCRIPDIDPFDPAIMRQLKDSGELTCEGKVSITYVDGSVLRINRTAVQVNYGGDFKYCQYQAVHRGSKNSDFAFAYRDMSSEFDHDILIPPGDEFMRVYCYSQSEGRLSTNFHALVTPKPEVEQLSNYRFKRHKKVKAPKEVFNVHMIGVDSVSRLNFIRQMKQTRQFLLKDLGAFEMTGYNKVEDNTFVNIVPMMAGKFVHETGWNESMRKVAFDDYNFFWKNFSTAGYRTLYAEDAPKIAIFVYGKEGFHEPPTDYYNRPLTLAMEMHKSVWNRDHHCVYDRLETSMVLDYVTDFSRVFKAKPVFSFSFITRLTHDDVRLVSSADHAYLKFLKRFKREGHLDNSIIIFYSDHGYRFGDSRNSYVGKVEERLPFLFLVFPQWFREKYPELVKNLNTNSRRLTTPFDIYETLKDILYFDGEARKGSLRDRGISLFREIPRQRNCKHAAILPHWCLCMEEQSLPARGQMAGKIGAVLLGYINQILGPHSDVCARLSLENVSSLVEMHSNDNVLRFEDSVNDVINKTVVYGKKTKEPKVYQVTLSTTPGHALFEATLTYDPEGDVFKLAGDISRINAYGDQSLCMEDFVLKKFCFCT